jgi:osmotically inducible protein OsmC
MTLLIEPVTKPLLSAEAISRGGRSGSVTSPDGLLDLTLGNPLTRGAERLGPNPELLFAAAYSICYHGALISAAKKFGTVAEDSLVRARVGLVEEGSGGNRLAVELHASMPGFERAQVQTLMNAAHKSCPYSRALRGDATVTLVVDRSFCGERGAVRAPVFRLSDPRPRLKGLRPRSQPGRVRPLRAWTGFGALSSPDELFP